MGKVKVRQPDLVKGRDGLNRSEEDDAIVIVKFEHKCPDKIQIMVQIDWHLRQIPLLSG